MLTISRQEQLVWHDTQLDGSTASVLPPSVAADALSIDVSASCLTKMWGRRKLYLACLAHGCYFYVVLISCLHVELVRLVEEAQLLCCSYRCSKEQGHDLNLKIFANKVPLPTLIVFSFI